MGTALIDLYSSNYQESTSRRSASTNDGNGNAGTIVRNKRSIIKDKKLSGLRAILFDSNPSKVNESNYHTLSGFTNGELLVNISEEEEKTPNDEQPQTKELHEKDAKPGADKRSGPEFCKSSSDGCKIRPLITQVPAGGSMQVLNNVETRPRQRTSSGNQIEFGKVIARFPMIYVGQKFLDKKYTLPMLPWLVAEFRREVLPIGNSPGSSNLSFNSSSSAGSSSFGLSVGLQGPFKKERKRIWFEISDRGVLGFDRQQSGFDELNKSFTADSEKEAFSRMNALNEGYLFLHKNNWICKVQAQPHEDGDLFCFVYLTRDFGQGFGQNNEFKPYTLHVFECDEKQIVSVHVSVIFRCVQECSWSFVKESSLKILHTKIACHSVC